MTEVLNYVGQLWIAIWDREHTLKLKTFLVLYPKKLKKTQ